MRDNLIKIALVASFCFALAFTLSCSGDDSDNDSGGDVRNEYSIPSSSSEAISSSSNAVEQKDYCVYSENQKCYFGPYSVCPGVGGVLSNFCPYGSSSSVAASSSSQVGSSSSSQNGKSSSSAVLEYEYCIFVSDRICLIGPLSDCPPGGTLSNSCPYSSSSTPISSSSSSLSNSNSSSSLATYTIIYDANNGIGEPIAQTKTYNVTLTLSATIPTRTGFAFIGWNTKADGRGVSYAPEASYTDNAGVILYAQWKLTKTIILNANGGTIDQEILGYDDWSNGYPITEMYDAAIWLPDAFKRTGYILVGWNTQANGRGTFYEYSYTGQSSVTLYAQWSVPLVSNCDGVTFREVEIGTQTWMGENLNCNIKNSKCVYNDETRCTQYGRLYDWATAKLACPSGWHLPSSADWDKLLRYIDGNTDTSSPYISSTAGEHLKATSWVGKEPVWGQERKGLDTYGFSALPGGFGQNDGSFSVNQGYGYWWTSTISPYNNNIPGVEYRKMGSSNHSVTSDYYFSSYLLSVRCLKN